MAPVRSYLVPFFPAFLLLGALAACGKKAPDASKPAPTASPSAAKALAELAFSSVAKDKAAKPAPTAKPKDAPVDKGAQATYAGALKEGRAATVAKKYDDAVVAFSKALSAVPGDARALSERGYAKYLAGKLDAAEADFRQAETATKDAKLLASIYFNHGLVAEKRNLPEVARAAFAKSDQLRSTPAAAKKLAGASACGAAIATASSPLLAVNGYLGVYIALRALHSDAREISSEDEAKTGLCARVPDGKCGDVVSFGEDMYDYYAIFPGEKEGTFLVSTVNLGSHYDMPCGGEETLSKKVVDGKTVLTFSATPGMRIPVCEGKDGSIEPCDETNGDRPASSACGSSDEEVTVLVVDLAQKKTLVNASFTQGDLAHAVKGEVAAGVFTVTGAGCDAKIPL
jgi:Tfp pilus assembly protein PilF